MSGPENNGFQELKGVLAIWVGYLDLQKNGEKPQRFNDCPESSACKRLRWDKNGHLCGCLVDWKEMSGSDDLGFNASFTANQLAND